MRELTYTNLKLVAITLWLLVSAGTVFCQTQPDSTSQLSIKTAPVLKAFLRTEYREQLEAQGGSAPYTWKLTHGDLPQKISLEPSGILSGLPTETGDFHFVVTITDSGRPAHQRNQEFVLRVLAPLFIQWGRQAVINGQRIEGSIKVSNQTGQDFDLTEVVVAVNEIGRATALGYQHFPLKQNTIDFEIPFGENLPPGGYVVNVDVVAEIAATNTIHRARLVTGKLQMVQGP